MPSRWVRRRPGSRRRVLIRCASLACGAAWAPGGHEWIGKRVRRFFVAYGVSDGRIVGYLPPENDDDNQTTGGSSSNSSNSSTNFGREVHQASGVGYVPQAALVVSGTVRENVILDRPYDAQRFADALDDEQQKRSRHERREVLILALQPFLTTILSTDLH